METLPSASLLWRYLRPLSLLTVRLTASSTTARAEQGAMESPTSADMEPEDPGRVRPPFVIGQHDSSRKETLTDAEYSYVLSTGVSPTPCATNERDFF